MNSVVYCIYQEAYKAYVLEEGHADVQKLFAEAGIQCRNIFVTPKNIAEVLAEVPTDALVFNNCDETPNDVNSLGRILRSRFPRFIGCGPEYIERTSFKSWATDLLIANGVPTPGYVLVSVECPGTEEEVLKLGPGKYFIKVDKGFDSVGITEACVCKSPAEALTQARKMAAQYGPCVINPMISGREFTIAVYDNKVGAPCEKILRSHAFYASSQAAQETEICTEPALVAHLQELALAAYHAVGGDSYCRVDIRQDPVTLNNYVLDVNSVCSIAPDSYFFWSLRECARPEWRTTKVQFIEYLISTAGQSQRLCKAPSTLQFALGPFAMDRTVYLFPVVAAALTANHLRVNVEAAEASAAHDLLSSSSSTSSSSESSPLSETHDIFEDSALRIEAESSEQALLDRELRRSSLSLLSVSAC
jgi:hypothetical protein